jgi:hypothetical protein
MDKLNISDSEDEFPVYKKSKNPQSSINGEQSEPKEKIKMNTKIPITADYVLKKVITSHYNKPSHIKAKETKAK